MTGTRQAVTYHILASLLTVLQSDGMAIQTQALLAYVSTFALIILMKIVCFVLGYLTVRLGYVLIASGVKGEFKFAATMGGAKADLASVSPGLLFVLLGVLLIGYAIYVEKATTLTLPSAALNASPAPPKPPVPTELPLPTTEAQK